MASMDDLIEQLIARIEPIHNPSDALYGDTLWPAPTDVSPNRPLPALAPNRRLGPYPSQINFLKTHIALLREDFIRPLNEQVNAFRVTGRATDQVFRVLLGAKRTNWTDGDRVVGLRVKFLEKERVRKIKWEEDKLLLNGGLVLFSQDNFETYNTGIIRQSPPKLMVEMVSGISARGRNFTPSDMSLGEYGTWTMMETDAFYFPYLHVIESLKELHEAVPFKDEIISLRKVNPLPAYLEALYKKEGVFEKHVSAFRGSLDQSQWEALKHVLSHRVAAVQGPPGTGKTHLGVQIVKYLLSLKRAGHLHGPILVVTTTKHAVDTFLEKCLEFTSKVLHACGRHFERRERKKKQEGAREDADVGWHVPEHKQCVAEAFGDMQKLYCKANSVADRMSYMNAAEVLAVTTARAAYIRDKLASLRITTVIVEEAAEAMEAHVIASIPSSAQHLILLGDHKQLRPIPAHRDLADGYHLDISLQERLVNNGFPCPMLKMQRRMRPSIAKLISKIYPELENHHVTMNRPDVAGMSTNMYFLSHTHPEAQDLPNPSYYNTFEADMAVQLCEHLLKSGNAPSSITVLATYKRQVYVIQERMPKDSSIRITTVDNFQGEENDVIVLSLVRNNLNSTVGFMARENRACVALSRARNGLYMLGSLRTLHGCKAPVWQGVLHEVMLQEAVGDAIPLRVPGCRHGVSTAASSLHQVRCAEKACSACALLRCKAAAAAGRSTGSSTASSTGSTIPPAGAGAAGGKDN